LTESFLWRQRGIVLFILLYCLFNIKLPERSEKAIA
jgi:O-antigen ligase